MRGSSFRLRGRTLVLALCGAAVLALSAFAVVAIGASTSSPTPANKAVASGAKLMDVTPSSTGTPILDATLRTSKPEDLILQVSLECSILTSVTINGGPTDHAESQTSSSRIRVWVEVDGKIVPITDTSAPPQDPTANGNGTDDDKVTFCDRTHSRSVTDTESGLDGLDSSKDFLRTKDANAFNWVRLNTGSGIHHVVVKADLATSSTNTADATDTTGEIGNRTMVIEPTKLANDAVIAPSGS